MPAHIHFDSISFCKRTSDSYAASDYFFYDLFSGLAGFMYHYMTKKSVFAKKPARVVVF
jgi:hypothetical protein